MTILLYELVGADPTRPFSPHCWKIAMALAHKGLAFTSVPTRFTEVKTVEGATSATVPVLRNDMEVVGDSFQIALYLEREFPDGPSLFGGAGGEAMARFVERWSQLTVHPFLGAAALMDIHAMLLPQDQSFFRESREKRFGKRLELVPVDREKNHAAFLGGLEPLRSMLSYQPFIGGQSPLFSDYIIFGAFQWVRVVSPFSFLPPGDPISEWFERCLDLYEGFARRTPAVA